MKKQRIVIASILKPVDDTRMLDKMGRTLDASGSYQVYIIGYPSQRNPDGGSITLMPLKKFARLSFARIFASLKVMLKMIQVRPELLIVNTHELLIVGVLNRIFFGTHIYYDIRENYYRNLRYSNAFAAPLRPLLALWIRFKEKATAPFFKAFFIAEKGYEKEMDFFRGRSVVIENKSVVLPNLVRKKTPGVITILFSGTLAESTGIFQAIRLAKRLHNVSQSIRLRIVGVCAQYETLKKINAEIGGLNFITLTGGSKLVPHDDIVKAIFESDFGIICYPKSPHTENSIPTKLYEYLAYKLPILIQPHPVWAELCRPCNAAIEVDFDAGEAYSILEEMQVKEFYTSQPVGVSWEGEGSRLLEVLSGHTSPWF